MGSARDTFPLDIAIFLLETHHLSPLETSCYLHLQIHYWRHGALPAEAEALAAIAHVPVHAWSNAQAQLMHLFSIGMDGVLHSPRLDIRRGDWFGKHQRAKEKARKAANARWAKYWRSKDENEGEHAQDVMHAQAGAKHNDVPLPPSLIGSPRTPFLEPIHPTLPGEGSPVTPSTPPAHARVISVPTETPPNDGPAPANLGTLGGVSWLMPEASDLGPHQSVNKAKHRIFDRRGVGNGGNVVSSNTMASASHNPPQRLSARHSRKPANLPFGSESGEPRFEPFRAELFAFWKGQNPEGGECPWWDPDKRALSSLLQACPNMTLDEFKRLLRNRAVSEVNPASLPRDWVAKIQEFSAGRLDRFKLPPKLRRTL